MVAGLAERVVAGDLAVISAVLEAAIGRISISEMRRTRRQPLADLRGEAICELLASARDLRGSEDEAFVQLTVQRIRRRLGQVVQGERRRRKHGAPMDELAEDGHPAVEIETRFDQEVEDPRLARAMTRLSPRQRAIIVNTYWREMRPALVAAHQKRTVAAVTKLRRRAEAELARMLKSTSVPRPPKR